MGSERNMLVRLAEDDESEHYGFGLTGPRQS
jgi:hypothetical protein